MNHTLKQILFWTPRLAGILFVLFLSLFALDVFGMGYSLWETLAALFVHLIPSILLAIAIALAWKWEWIGAALFIGWGIFYAFFAPRGFEWSSFLLIAVLPALIGFLFLAGWVWRKPIHAR